jgi:hypothetical protein
MEMKRILAVGVILLFIGVAVAPSINLSVVKASTDDDLVEVTTQACGIQGYENTTVKLTREQYQDLEQYLVEFRARLNQTSTREEAVPIFKDAVVELDKYGLLPRGMSVEKAQKIVTGGYQKSQDKEHIQISKHHKSMLNENVNLFCLIAGQSSNTIFIPFVSRLVALPLILTLMFGQYFFLLFLFFYLIFFNAFSISMLVGNIFPVSFFNWICFGVDSGIQVPPGYAFPAQGWVSTIGLNGVKKWNQSFYGTIDYPVLNAGVIDFSGIKLLRLNGTSTYFGSALWVSIRSDTPG